jgi:sec-independent protein translocase protein TatC
MSGALDEDTVRTLNQGRETVGTLLSTAQKELQKVFIVFVLGLVGTIFVLRAYVWDFLRENTRSRMSDVVAQELDIIVRTPFDVILIQVKIGLVVGVLLAVPVLLYYARDGLRRRGFTSVVPVSRAYVAAFSVLATALFLGGLFYAYAVFFPFMFSFLAENALQSAITPNYDIVMYVQFLLLLTVSFGLAAQLPLIMSALAYTEVVPYETFRDKWRYAILGIFAFGALLSPPDPFTQVMWAVPLVALYVFSLGVAKLVTNVRRTEEAEAGLLSVRTGAAGLVGLFTLAAGTGYYGTQNGLLAWVNATVLPTIPASVSVPGFGSVGLRPGPLTVEGLVGLSGVAGDVTFALVTGIVTVVVVVFAFVLRVLRQPVVPRQFELRGDPEDINLEELDAAGVRSAPPEAFLGLSEDDAVELAGKAMEADQPEKAQALLDRFDEAESEREAADANGESDSDGDSDTEEESVFTSTAAGMASAFGEEETTEDDIGGYIYDIAFIFESVTSKTFRLVGSFMGTIAVSFYLLYAGGLKWIQRTFFSRVDPEVLDRLLEQSPETAVGTVGDGAYGFVVALHPVEHLIFMVKVSVIVGVLVTLPLVLYYIWPALRERGLVVGGDRRAFPIWGVSLLVGVVGGSLFGFLFVAPAVISWLVQDALEASMVISYRLNSFLWLVVFTTAGVGLLGEVPVTMWLFDKAGIVSYERMAGRWREVVIAVFLIFGLVVPGGILTMLITALPVTIAFGAGLALLWVLTLPRRVFGGGGGDGDSGDDSGSGPEPDPTPAD